MSHSTTLTAVMRANARDTRAKRKLPKGCFDQFSRSFGSEACSLDPDRAAEIVMAKMMPRQRKRETRCATHNIIVPRNSTCDWC